MNFYTRIFSLTAFLIFSAIFSAQVSKYKCMLQMTNYDGEKAYIVISLINPKGGYEKTLYMMGPDKKWQETLKEWNKSPAKKTPNLSAVTGASIAGGDRNISTFSIDDKYLDKGYKIRFESAVEDQKYNVTDLEIPFTKAGVITKVEGKGYIRYVKINKL
ncbi:flagellin biosynthesis protein FlgD [Chryseobacterium sp. Leaf180]|jgi:hypothetical protein|uniref:DUF2271 domain-containing protein n=1 Tax=Chryseobacterium sp. Leaf180 TaxID=1736289 RepID=UPI0006F71165|nr:DUF2271 domain-containing protein [Chryseobacterium sp. Leaf180]KQR94824.1 flagellin biosynthesis protein FlgD [Chryseobacterium sp. Leaf180]